MRPRGSVTEVIGFAFNNVVANWETIGLILGEAFVVFTFIGLPLFVAMFSMVGIGNDPLPWIRTHVALIVVFAVVLVVLLLASIAVAAAITAGVIRVYLDGFRAAFTGGAPKPPRDAYRVFTFENWWAAARALWLRMYLVDLALIGVALCGAAVTAGVLIPLGMATVGCVTPIVFIFVFIPIWVLFGFWTQKAKIVAIAFPQISVGRVLATSWSAFFRDFGAHLGTGIVMMLLTMALSFIPMVGQPGASCWFYAAYAGLTEPE